MGIVSRPGELDPLRTCPNCGSLLALFRVPTDAERDWRDETSDSYVTFRCRKCGKTLQAIPPGQGREDYKRLY